MEIKIGNKIIQVRKSEEKDVPLILEFIKASGFTERSLESWFGDNMEAVIALENNSLIGALPFSQRQLKIGKDLYLKAAHLSAVAVKEGYRSQGIGSHLLSFFKEGHLPQIDCLVVNRIDRDGQDRAYKWYRRNGFLDLINIKCLYAHTSELTDDNQREFGWAIIKIDGDNIERIDYDNLLKLFNLTFKNIAGFQKRDKDFWLQRFKCHYYKKLNTYYLLTLPDGKEIVAFFILGKNFIQQKEGKVDVLEYGFDRDKVNVKDLIRGLCSFCRAQSIPIIRWVVSDEITLYSQLLSMGFKGIEGFKFMLFPLKPQIINKKSRWTFLSFDYI